MAEKLFKLGCMSNAFMFQPLEEALQRVKDAGFESVEIMCDRPHMFPADYDKDARLRIRKLCDKLELEISILECIHVKYSSFGKTLPDTPYNDHIFFFHPNGHEPLLASMDPEMRQTRIDYVKSVIDMAVEMGVSTVETFTSMVTVNPILGEKMVLEGMTELVKYAESKKVTLCVESVNDLVLGSPEEIKWMIDKIGSPYFKACLDIGHLENERRNLVEVIEDMKGFVANFHVDDIRKHLYYGLVPGQGDINWEEVLSAIVRTGYDRAFNLEIYPYALDPVPAAQEGHDYLANCLARI